MGENEQCFKIVSVDAGKERKKKRYLIKTKQKVNCPKLHKQVDEVQHPS